MVLETLIPLVVSMATILILMLGVGALYSQMYVKLSSGQALIINKTATVEVFFTGGLVIPGVHKAEVMDINTKFLVIERTGSGGLICKDGIRADVRATFSLRVNKTIEDVLRVAQLVGADKAMNPETLEGLFSAKFCGALESFAAGKTFADLREQRSEFTDAVLEELGSDLQGYTLDALAIDRLEQTPVEHLDKNNILDAEGILAITKATTQAQVRVAELQAKHSRRMKELETESKELLVELESRQASALLRLREGPGAGLSSQELDDRLLDRLRALVDLSVDARLASQD